MNLIIRFTLAAFVLLVGCGDDSPSKGVTNSSTNTNTNGTNTNGNTNANNMTATSEVPVCTNGQCTCPTAGKVLCGDICVDLATDVEHCGGCGDSCGTEGICQSGVCACAAGALECGNECVDASTDVNNCGRCGNECNNNETCVAGNCEPLMCMGSQVACRNGCVDLSIDAQNCGQCGRNCGVNDVCVSGVCTCPAGNAACNQVGNQGVLVGGACAATGDCTTTCLDSNDFPGGTCSTGCQTDADCPESTLCIGVSGEGVCLLACREDNQCRNNYACRNRDRFGQGGESRVCFGD